MKITETIDSLVKCRTITMINVGSVVGEEIVFYCPGCEKQKFVVVPSDGSIACPDCGFRPDMSSKANAVTLSQESRLKMTCELFQKGSTADRYYIDLLERYGDGIDAVYSRKFPAATFYKTFNKQFAPLEKVADWLLAGRSEIPANYTAYSEAGLLRKQSSKNVKVVSLSNFSTDLNEELDVTPMEIVEGIALNGSYSESFYDKEFAQVELLGYVADPTDRQIVKMISQGDSKTDVAKKLGLTTQRLQTRLKHIGTQMVYGPTLRSRVTKFCKSCDEAKPLNDFGRDARRRDGLQGICKACDVKRKKNISKFTGIPLKIA